MKLTKLTCKRNLLGVGYKKRIKCKIRPIKGIRRVYCGESGMDEGTQSMVELLMEMGYFVYEDPASDSSVIVSDKTLTYGDLRKNAKRLAIDTDWWDNDTDYASFLKDQELDEVTL